MQEYVAGFLFEPDHSKVILIQKNKPEWQKGKLNGVGGKIEYTADGIYELPQDAMRREFFEEAGVEIIDWELFLTLKGKDWVVYFLRTFGDTSLAKTMEQEIICTADPFNLPQNTIYNLRWIIPLALDTDFLQFPLLIHYEE